MIVKWFDARMRTRDALGIHHTILTWGTVDGRKFATTVARVCMSCFLACIPLAPSYSMLKGRSSAAGGGRANNENCATQMSDGHLCNIEHSGSGVVLLVSATSCNGRVARMQLFWPLRTFFHQPSEDTHSCATPAPERRALTQIALARNAARWLGSRWHGGDAFGWLVVCGLMGDQKHCDSAPAGDPTNP